MKNILLILILVAIMLFGLAPFGSPNVKLDNLGDLNVDVAFQFALPYFLEQQLQFGEQVVFTYGPWGILISPFTGPTWHSTALTFRVVFSISVSLAMFTLAARYYNCRGGLFVSGGVLVLVSLWLTGHRDSYFLLPALLVAYQRWAAATAADGENALPVFPGERLLWIVLSALAGWVALAKFNFFIVSCVAFLLILIDDSRVKRWPLLPAVFVLSLLLGWFSAGQELDNLVLWVSRSLGLANGYADAMAKGFFVPYSVELVAVYYGAVAAILVVALTAAATQYWKIPAVLSLVLTTFVCAVSIKHGMGGNQLEQSLALLATVLWFSSQLLLIPRKRVVGREANNWNQVGLVAFLTAFTLLAVVAAGANFPIRSPKDALIDMRSNIAFLAQVVRGESTDHWEESLEKAHRFWRPTNVAGIRTIDVYPQHTALVIGRESLRYDPRPAFLSLNAHTAALASLNARHLQGEAAPDAVLFRLVPKELSITNRHPAQADGRSWPLLLSRYAIMDGSGEFLLLIRRQSPANIERRLILEADFKFGELVEFPTALSTLLWAEIDVKRTAVGSLIHAVFKSPHVLIESRTAEDSIHTAQLVPELGRSGFLISPLVQTNSEFAALYRGSEKSVETIRSIRILSPEAPKLFWNTTYTLRLYTLDISPKS